MSTDGIARTTVSALQQTLAHEHAALWLYGVLGARTSRSDQPQLHAEITRGYEVHRSRRDHLERRLRDLAAEPVAAEPAYPMPERLGSATGVRSAARGAESACATAYAAQVAATTDADRRWAVASLTDAAARELVFRGTPENFPGIHELAGR